jgi:hypothetical protein
MKFYRRLIRTAPAFGVLLMLCVRCLGSGPQFLTPTQQTYVRNHGGMIFYQDKSTDDYTLTDLSSIAQELGATRAKTWMYGDKLGDIKTKVNNTNYTAILQSFQTVCLNVCPNYIYTRWDAKQPYATSIGPDVHQDFYDVGKRLATVPNCSGHTFLVSLFFECNLYFGVPGKRPDFPVFDFIADAKTGLLEGWAAGGAPSDRTLLTVLEVNGSSSNQYFAQNNWCGDPNRIADTTTDLYSYTYYNSDPNAIGVLLNQFSTYCHPSPLFPTGKNLMLGEYGKLCDSAGAEVTQQDYLERIMAQAADWGVPYLWDFWLADQQNKIAVEGHWGLQDLKNTEPGANKWNAHRREAWCMYQTIFLTAPQVTDDGLYMGQSDRLHFSWTAVPGASEYQYAVGVSSTDTSIRGWTDLSPTPNPLEYTATGLTTRPGNKLYVQVRATSCCGDGGSPGVTNGVGVVRSMSTLGLAKGVTNSKEIFAVNGLTANTSAADFTGMVFVQDDGRTSGMRVNTTSPIRRGDTFDLQGSIKRVDGEWQMTAVEPVLTTTGTAPTPLVSSQIGLIADKNEDLVFETVDRAGLLVKTCGRVQAVDSTAGVFYVDDGSILTDGIGASGNAVTGLRVAYRTFAPPGDQHIVSVTGILRTEKRVLTQDTVVNGETKHAGQTIYVPVLYPRDSSDIVILL